MADRPRKGKRGRKSYKKRGQTCLRVARSQAVTPVFGQIKGASRMDRFIPACARRAGKRHPPGLLRSGRAAWN